MKDFWRHWPAVQRGLTARKRLLLLVDFDGTLARLEKRPEHARVPRAVRDSLARLAAGGRVKVAVLSGRPLGFLEDALRLRDLYLGGNHGLELCGPGLRYAHQGARALRPLIRAAARDLRAAFGAMPGAIVEDKGLSLSLHYRAVPSRRRAGLDRLVHDFRARTADHSVVWRTGKYVWELRPRVPWDKGAAARRLLEHLPGSYPIAVGDDATDEDMFASLEGRGLTVRVGRAGTSLARYYLARQRDVLRLLKALEALP